MRSGIVYLALLCAFLAAYLTGVFDFAHDFVAAFGHWIWAAYSGILFFFYPLVQRRISRLDVSTFFTLLGRLLLLFFLGRLYRCFRSLATSTGSSGVAARSVLLGHAGAAGRVHRLHFGIHRTRTS